MTDFLTEMDALAAEIAKAAREAASDLSIKIDAFKALTPYYAQQVKLKGKNNSEDDDLPSFDNFQSRIAEANDGAEQSRVRSSRRNGN